MKKLPISLFISLLILFVTTGCTIEEGKAITAFCGSTSKPAMEEATKAFEVETGIIVNLNFSGSGTVPSQMKLSHNGDLYIPGSSDYIVIAERDDVIEPESVKIITYLIPAILVQNGNPSNIQSLSDLDQPGINMAIRNPELVCACLYAYEILEHNNLLKEVSNNIITNAESCSKTASLMALKSVDAIIGWRIFSKWNPDTTDMAYLMPGQIPRIAHIPGAISKFTENKEYAQMFLDFLVSQSGQDLYLICGDILLPRMMP
ncbi:substrate-binding domain-containing protein [Chloroflexota bacterium]